MVNRPRHAVLVKDVKSKLGLEVWIKPLCDSVKQRFATYLVELKRIV